MLLWRHGTTRTLIFFHSMSEVTAKVKVVLDNDLIMLGSFALEICDDGNVTGALSCVPSGKPFSACTKRQHRATLSPTVVKKLRGPLPFQERTLSVLEWVRLTLASPRTLRIIRGGLFHTRLPFSLFLSFSLSLSFSLTLSLFLSFSLFLSHSLSLSLSVPLSLLYSLAAHF